ncbi:MAG: diguanylate cyclase [Candidatus Aminicenantes bacterium]|nr:diguanylate cyclase [Candidatus Aminicenantes bacterium]
MKSIRVKILLATMPWLGAFCLLILIISPLQIKKALIETTTSKVLRVAGASAETITVPVYFQDDTSIKEELRRLWKSGDIVYIVIQNSTGEIIASQGLNTAEHVRYADNKGNRFTPDENLFLTVTPIDYQDVTLGRMFIGFKTDFIASEIQKIRTRIIVFCFLFFFLGTAAVILMSGWVTGPLKTMTAAAGQIAEGDLSRRVRVQTRDETGILAGSFNKMVDRLQELYQNLESKVENRTEELRLEIGERRKAEDLARENETLLRSMLEGLGDGVGIVDEQEVFTVSNPALEEIFGGPPGGLSGRSVTDFLTQSGIELVVGQTQQRRKGVKGVYDLEIITIAGERKMLLINAMPRFDREGRYIGTLVVFTDITQRKHAENQVREANEKLRRNIVEMERRNTELGLLYEMGESLQTCQSEEEIYAIGARFGEKIFPQQSGAFFLAEKTSGLLDIKSSWGNYPSTSADLDTSDCWGLRRGKTYILENPEKDLVCRHIAEAGLSGTPSLCVPMTSYGDLRGVLTISYAPLETKSRFRRNGVGSEAPLSGELRPRLAANLAEYIGTAVVNLRLRESLREKSIRDPLTGLFNRRFMEETLEREIRRAIWMKAPVGMIVADIDHFKIFNDTYGHEAGDIMLREISRLLTNHVRQEDVVCRLGGEEFLLIMPGATLDLVKARAERLCTDAHGQQILYMGQPIGPVTLSFGCGSFPDDGEDGAEVIKTADMRLLQAKREGRDRVVC